jgi:hypothetical protein
MDELSTLGSASQGVPKTEAKAIKRRLNWKLEGNEIVRSDARHKVFIHEGSTDVTSGVGIPPGEDLRESGTGGLGVNQRRFVGASSRDRFEFGSGSSPTDRFESVDESRPADRFATGATSPNHSGHEMVGGNSPPNQTQRSNGPVTEAVRFDDSYMGGSGEVNESRARGGPWVTQSFRDKSLGGEGESPNANPQPAPGLDGALIDRYDFAVAPSQSHETSHSLPSTQSQKDSLVIPESQTAPQKVSYRGTRKPRRIDDILREVPKPVYSPVEIFKDSAGLSKRLTGIRAETADIRDMLPLNLRKTATDEQSRKVSSWPKIKIPK